VAAFEDLDWRRLDVWAIVAGRGLATVEQIGVPMCEDWLRREGYRIVPLDFANGIGDVVVGLGQMLDWGRQFGYELSRDSRNLDALRDGFDFDPGSHAGAVLVLHAFERAWTDDARWSRGFLEIACEHSLRQLAVGKRFFAVVIVADPSSPLIGLPLEGHCVGHLAGFR
jgi:hypothetical protein